MTQPIGYFHFDKEGFSIAIVERTFWEENGVLDGDGIGVLEDMLPEGFYELTESVYEFDGDTEDARAKLKAIGLEEKKLFDEE